jgi:hypothetical protein
MLLAIKVDTMDAAGNTVDVGLVLKMSWLCIQVIIQAYQRSSPALLDQLYRLTR